VQDLLAGARDRRVQEGQSVRRGAGGKRFNAVGLAGRGAKGDTWDFRGSGFDQPSRAFDHVFDLAHAHHGDQIELAAARDLGHRLDRLSTHAAQFLTTPFSDVETDHSVAGVE
jgi:hypothetical protein